MATRTAFCRSISRENRDRYQREGHETIWTFFDEHPLDKKAD